MAWIRISPSLEGENLGARPNPLYILRCFSGVRMTTSSSWALPIRNPDSKAASIALDHSGALLGSVIS